MATLHRRWQDLEARTAAHCTYLRDCADEEATAANMGSSAGHVHELEELVKCCDVLVELLLQRRGGGKRDGGREGWAVRLTHKAYTELPPEYRPFDYIPSPTVLVQTLIAQIGEVRGCRARFLRAKERAPHHSDYPSMDRSTGESQGVSVSGGGAAGESAGEKLKRSIAEAKSKAAASGQARKKQKTTRR
jgi:hypothetical protein